MRENIILVMDCGATIVRTIAVDGQGKMLAKYSLPNNTQKDPYFNEGLIWDVNEIWDKLVKTTRQVLQDIDKSKIAGITVTTFGVDGAPVTKEGELTYPVISWQCGRTIPVMENIDKYIPVEELYRINGVLPMGINTINKLIWLKENKPEVLEKMDHYLFISSVFLYYLTDEFVTDLTMAGTSMLTDISKRDFSEKILSSIGLERSLFPKTVEPGEVVGHVTPEASSKTGLPQGIPVVATGHDTQFAIFGSGADKDVPVLSTGTWEILMVRSEKYKTDKETLQFGITTELDAMGGLYNPGCQWVGSGVIEWIKKMFFAREADKENIYDIMISEAEEAGVGSQGVYVKPSFFADKVDAGTGAIMGLNMYTSRGSVFRAALESLSCKLKQSLEILENAGGFKTDSLIVVGGGSKNKLWNQIRADMLGVPVKIIDQKETTVLGASLFAMSGVGLAKSADEARKNINYNAQIIKPQKNIEYQNVYDRFISL